MGIREYTLSSFSLVEVSEPSEAELDAAEKEALSKFGKLLKKEKSGHITKEEADELDQLKDVIGRTFTFPPKKSLYQPLPPNFFYDKIEKMKDKDRVNRALELINKKHLTSHEQEELKVLKEKGFSPKSIESMTIKELEVGREDSTIPPHIRNEYDFQLKKLRSKQTPQEKIIELETELHRKDLNPELKRNIEREIQIIKDKSPSEVKKYYFTPVIKEKEMATPEEIKNITDEIKALVAKAGTWTPEQTKRFNELSDIIKVEKKKISDVTPSPKQEPIVKTSSSPATETKKPSIKSPPGGLIVHKETTTSTPSGTHTKAEVSGAPVPPAAKAKTKGKLKSYLNKMKDEMKKEIEDLKSTIGSHAKETAKETATPEKISFLKKYGKHLGIGGGILGAAALGGLIGHKLSSKKKEETPWPPRPDRQGDGRRAEADRLRRNLTRLGY